MTKLDKFSRIEDVVYFIWYVVTCVISPVVGIYVTDELLIEPLDLSGLVSIIVWLVLIVVFIVISLIVSVTTG